MESRWNFSTAYAHAARHCPQRLKQAQNLFEKASSLWDASNKDVAAEDKAIRALAIDWCFDMAILLEDVQDLLKPTPTPFPPHLRPRPGQRLQQAEMAL